MPSLPCWQLVFKISILCISTEVRRYSKIFPFKMSFHLIITIAISDNSMDIYYLSKNVIIDRFTHASQFQVTICALTAQRESKWNYSTTKKKSVLQGNSSQPFCCNCLIFEWGKTTGNIIISHEILLLSWCVKKICNIKHNITKWSTKGTLPAIHVRFSRAAPTKMTQDICTLLQISKSPQRRPHFKTERHS